MIFRTATLYLIDLITLHLTVSQFITLYAVNSYQLAVISRKYLFLTRISEIVTVLTIPLLLYQESSPTICKISR